MNKNLIQAENYELNQDYKKAINCYYEILKYNKNDLNTLNKIGMCFFNLGNFEMAIKNFEKILPQLNQPIPDLLTNIGFCYGKIKDYNTALKYYIKANKIKPSSNNYKILGDLYFYMKKYDESIKCYDKADENNNNHIILYNKCFPYLAQKKYKIGLELYEYRLYNNYCDQTKMNARVEIPNIDYWDGIKECKRLLVVYEQGIGDNIMYYRFIIELSNKYPDMTIDYFCKDIVSHLFNIYNNINIIDNVELSLYDYKLYIMSLPKILNIETIKPNSINYINVNEDKLNYWNNIINSLSNKYKVGIVCNGLLSSFIDKNIPIEYFNKLKELNVELISLDKDNNSLNIDIDKPFEDTICILRNIDLLITIDTAIVHIAGVLNINTWLLLGYGSDWRWFNDNNCYWYNSVNILRMTENKPLYNIIDIVYNKLKDII
jgi:tetratricopeptide (TPR) repeat protein